MRRRRLLRQPARPATPINLTVSINDARVAVSPAAVGAGSVVFLVANQARTTQALTIRRGRSDSAPIARTGPINPGSTGQVTVDLAPPGRYVVTSSPPAAFAATGPPASAILPASIDVGPPRPSPSNTLTEP